MKLVITIDIPVGADVVFDDAPGPDLIPGEMESLGTIPPLPLPAATLPIHPVLPPNPIGMNPKFCPMHTSTPTRHVPAGTIKAGPKAGKPYNCFVSCGEAKGVCSWKSDCVEHPKVVA